MIEQVKIIHSFKRKQQEYASGTLDGEPVFIKVLLPHFYHLSKEWYQKLKPIPHSILLESQFFDDKCTILQPQMKGSILHVTLQQQHIEKNLERIKAFVKTGNDEYFYKLDINRNNLMVDLSRENVYLVDFDPCQKPKPKEAWISILKKVGRNLTHKSTQRRPVRYRRKRWL